MKGYSFNIIRPGDQQFTTHAEHGSIFLAGPTSRHAINTPPHPVCDTPWRLEAFKALDLIGYEGSVFSPEPFVKAQPELWHDTNNKLSNPYWTEEQIQKVSKKKAYSDQIRWEQRALEFVSCITFWIPRDLKSLPGFTTNVEFGVWYQDPKTVVGWPEGTPKTGYLQFLIGAINRRIARDVHQLMLWAVGHAEMEK